jgi:glycosyltransferase involved in cell wall biosynthesis
MDPMQPGGPGTDPRTDPRIGPRNSPRIGVVIPVYNVREYLDEALDSVTRQTYRAAEVVVVDDGSVPPVSVDETRHPHLPRLRQIRLPQNQGLSAARNRGVRELDPTIDVIAFLDGDDVWPDHRLEALVGAWAEPDPDPDFVFGQMQNVDARLRPQAPATAGRMINSGLIRRRAFEHLGGFDEAVRVGQPIDLLSRAEQHGMRVQHIGTLTLLRRIHGRNISATGPDERKAYAEVVRQHLARRRGHST